MMKRKAKELMRPLWKNYYPDYQSAVYEFVMERLYEHIAFGTDKDPAEGKDNPILADNGEAGAIAISSNLESDTDTFLYRLKSIDRILESELKKGNPKTSTDLTPRQKAIVEIESECLSPLIEYIESRCSESIDRDAVSSALAFGATIMRLSMEEPGSDLGRWFAIKKQNKKNAPSGGAATAYEPDFQKIIDAFAAYKRKPSNKGHSYATAEANIAHGIGYKNPRKLGKRIKDITGISPAKWFSTL